MIELNNLKLNKTINILYVKVVVLLSIQDYNKYCIFIIMLCIYVLSAMMIFLCYVIKLYLIVFFFIFYNSSANLIFTIFFLF